MAKTKKDKIALVSKKQEFSSFMGWLTILIGTWMIASTLRQMVMDMFIGNKGPIVAYIIGFVFIGAAVALFGKKKPWNK